MITVWWWKLVLVNSNSNSMLLFWNGRWCWVITWGHYFRPDHMNFAIFMCCCWNMLSCESMGHAGLAGIKHHLVLVVGVGPGCWLWIKHRKIITWPKCYMQIKQEHLCTSGRAVAGLGLPRRPGCIERRNQTLLGKFVYYVRTAQFALNLGENYWSIH